MLRFNSRSGRRLTSAPTVAMILGLLVPLGSCDVACSQVTREAGSNQPVASRRVTDSRISFVAYHQSGEALWIVTEKAHIHVVNPLTLEPLAKPRQLFDATVSGAGLLSDQSGMLLSSYGGLVLPVGTSSSMPPECEVADGIRPVSEVGYQSMALEPSDGALALGTRKGSVALVDLQTGALLWTVSLGEIPINSVAWSGDGKKLAVCSGNWRRPKEPGLVYLLDPKNGDVIKKLADHRGQVNQVAFSPDGNWLTSASADTRVLTYDLRDLEKPPLQLKRAAGVDALLYLGDGTCVVATFGGGVQICDLQQGQTKVAYSGHRSRAAEPGMPKPKTPLIRAMSVSSDGSHLVTTDFNGMVYVWQLTGQNLLQDPKQNSAIFSPGQFVSTHWNADPTADIFKIGTFTQAGEQGRPVGWKNLSAFEAGQAQLETRGRGTVTLSSTDGAKTSIATDIDLPPKTEHVTFMVLQRGPSIERGDDKNAGGGVTFSLVDSKGARREMSRIEPRYEGYRNWTNGIHTAQVRPGETGLRVSITLDGATGGIEVDNILIIPSDDDNEATTEQIKALNLALKNDDAETIAKLIEDDPQMLEMRTGQSDNGTPLIRAAWTVAPKVAAKLIELGADLEARDINWGNTPMRWCCWFGNHEVAAVLIDAGADLRGASQMAQSSKTGNRFAKRSKEDFDKLSKLVDEYEARQGNE
jgi:WD40 repeat protein